VARLVRQEFGFHVYDADVDLTPEMKLAISEHRVFTDDMRDRYFEIVLRRIAELRKVPRNVIVAQGLFKNRNRMQILREHADAEFVSVQSPAEANRSKTCRQGGSRCGATLRQTGESALRGADRSALGAHQ
jgi:hypothetical protein